MYKTKIFSLPSIILVVLALFMATVSARVWNSSEYDQVRWAAYCDFIGYGLEVLHIPGDQCGRACLDDRACTHFSNTRTHCYLKRNVYGWTEQDSRDEDCGFIPERTNQSTSARQNIANSKL